MSTKIKTIKNNMLLILLGFVLAGGLIFVFKNTELLQASILSMSDYTTIKENNRDIGYKTQNNRIEVFCSDTLPTQADTIAIHIVYDDISIDWTQAEYQNSINIDSSNPNETYVTLTAIDHIDCKESLIDVPFEGSFNKVIVDSVSIDNKNLKIGNLNKNTQHG